MQRQEPMAITKEENLVHYSKNSNSLNNNNRRESLLTCRLANHHISAKRVSITDYNTHYDKIGNADRYVFIVRCHHCNLGWTELWTTSKWFMKSNSLLKSSD